MLLKHSYVFFRMDVTDMHGDYSASSFEEGFKVVSQANIEELKHLMSTKGMKYVKSFMETKLNGWKSQPLHC